MKSDALTTDHRPLTTDILVNATPLGTRGEREDETAATADELRGINSYMILCITRSKHGCSAKRRWPERKLSAASTCLSHKVRNSSVIWTGEDAPVDVMKSRRRHTS